MAVVPRYRLKQTPTDVWCIRERLCLASSVLRSGDQNWVSVSRAIKPFGEPNRPPDWFSQKNCALQYSDLLEKVETPKRKRWDRGEKDTPGDMIVRKLTIERIEELKRLIQEEQQKYKIHKREVELVRSGQVDDKLDEHWEQILEEKKNVEKAELDHQKWLKEREIRIAAMKAMPRMGLGPGKKKLAIKQPRIGEIQSCKSSQSEASEHDSILDSPISEPLSVDVDDAASPMPSAFNSEGPPTTPKSLAVPSSLSTPGQTPPPHPTPSTSPLLTSLLKSPTPATPASPISSFLSSPTSQPKEGATATSQASPRPVSTPQPFFNPTSALATAAARQLAVATAPVLPGLATVASLFSLEKSEVGHQTVTTGSPTTPVHSATSSAPTLSRLLEMPPSTPGKLPPLPVIHAPESSVSNLSSVYSSPTKQMSLLISSSAGDSISSTLETELSSSTLTTTTITNANPSEGTSSSTPKKTVVSNNENKSLEPSYEIKTEVKVEPLSPMVNTSLPKQRDDFETEDVNSDKAHPFVENNQEIKREEQIIPHVDSETANKTEGSKGLKIQTEITTCSATQEEFIGDEKQDIFEEDECSLKEEIKLPESKELSQIRSEVGQTVLEQNKICTTTEQNECTDKIEAEALNESQSKEKNSTECLDSTSRTEAPKAEEVISEQKEQVKEEINKENCIPESESTVKEELIEEKKETISSVTQVTNEHVKKTPGRRGRKTKLKINKAQSSSEIETKEVQIGDEETKKAENVEIEKDEIQEKQELKIEATDPKVISDSTVDENTSSVIMNLGDLSEMSEPPTPPITSSTPQYHSEDGDKDDSDSKADQIVTSEAEMSEAPTPILSSKEETSSSQHTESSGEEVTHDIKSKAPSVVGDSIPNSPASTSQSDDQESLREYKVWKKSIMLVWRAAANHKYANVFLHPVTNDVAPGYHSIVYRPMDLSAIKKNIETGIIKTTMEFQRDMMLMFQNAIMYNSSDHDVHHMAKEMQKEVMEHIQDFLATQLMVQTADTKVLRGRESRDKKADLEKEEEGKRKRLSTGDRETEPKMKKRRNRVDENQ